VNEAPRGIVHYVLYNGECRPFLITKFWPTYTINEVIRVNGTLFIDGSNDYQQIPQFSMPFDPRDHPSSPILTIWKTSVKFSGNNESDTWHYPETA
jgi:hypothetical protein